MLAEMKRLRSWAGRLKQEISALGRALADPRTPWYAKVLAGAVVAYALSPLDLIPDFIPVLGQLDDLILLPLGVALVRRLIPDNVMADCRATTAEPPTPAQRRLGTVATVAVVLIWVALLAVLIRAAVGRLSAPRT